MTLAEEIQELIQVMVKNHPKTRYTVSRSSAMPAPLTRCMTSWMS